MRRSYSPSAMHGSSGDRWLHPEPLRSAIYPPMHAQLAAFARAATGPGRGGRASSPRPTSTSPGRAGKWPGVVVRDCRRDSESSESAACARTAASRTFTRSASSTPPHTANRIVQNPTGSLSVPHLDMAFSPRPLACSSNYFFCAFSRAARSASSFSLSLSSIPRATGS